MLKEKLREKRIETARKIVKKISEKFKVNCALVFGSVARGDLTLASDLDLLIVSESFRGIRYIDRVRKILEVADPGVDMDVIALTPEELERKKKSTLFKKILKEAIKII